MSQDKREAAAKKIVREETEPRPGTAKRRDRNRRSRSKGDSGTCSRICGVLSRTPRIQKKNEAREGITHRGKSREAVQESRSFQRPVRLGKLLEVAIESCSGDRCSKGKIVCPCVDCHRVSDTPWNTVDLERVVQALRTAGNADDNLLPHLSPLGWEHINLAGDYNWRQNRHVEQGDFRPLPPLNRP